MSRNLIRVCRECTRAVGTSWMKSASVVPLYLPPTMNTVSVTSSSYQPRLIKLACATQYRSYNTDSEEAPAIFNVENELEFRDKVVASPVPVLVDFYADWCGPCKLLGPRIEAKVAGREGSVLLAKVNVDYAADLAMDFEVNAVPTVIAFKNGEPVARFEGDQSDDDLDHFIDGVIES